MALNAQVAAITANTLAGGQTTSGVGFQPKLLMMLGSRTTTAGSIAGASFGLGYGDVVHNETFVGFNSADNVATTDAVRTTLNTRIFQASPPGDATEDCSASLTSFNSDGWQLNYNAASSAFNLGYLALGGSDIANTVTGTFAMNSTTGSQSVTGLGFTPDVVFFSVVNATALGSVNTHYALSYGAATATSQWGVAVAGRSGAGTSNTRRAFRTNACGIICYSNSDAVEVAFNIVSMDVDGFTINISGAAGAGTTYQVAYTAIKGGRWKVGTFQQPTTTGNQSVTGVGFEPSGVIIGSASHDAISGVPVTARLSYGFATGSSNQQSVWVGDEDAIVGNTNADSRYATNRVVMFYDEAGGGAPTAQAEASYVSNDVDGFTVNWTTADTTQRYMGYVAFGASPVRRVFHIS